MDILQQLSSIELAIDNAVADEARTARLRAVVREAAARNGDAIDAEEVGRGVEFVERYVRSAPAVLRESLGRSAGTFAADKMRRMIEAAAAYWDAEDDIIPDDQGLLGILDDAYCSLELVRRVSDRFSAETGDPLVRGDLAGPTAAVRNLLGHPVCQQLDDYVEEALADASVDELLESLAVEPLAPPPQTSAWTNQDDELILKLFGVMG